jgi:hypothetical protein
VVAVAPLAATLARLDAADEYCEYRVGEPVDGSWVRLDDMLDDPALFDASFDAVVAGEARGRRDVAGSYLASWLVGIVVEPAVMALTTEQRTWPLAAANLAVRPHQGGWFDGLAVLDPDVWMLPGDPDAAHPDSVIVSGLADLRIAFIAGTAALARRVFPAVRARAPFGMRGMWGSLADGLGARVVAAAEEGGGDVDAAWADVARLLDLLEAWAPVRPTRPRLDRVDWDAGSKAFTVRGTCCLFFKTVEGPPDRFGDDYCTSCPLRDDEWRRQRWAALMAARTSEREATS